MLSKTHGVNACSRRILFILILPLLMESLTKRTTHNPLSLLLQKPCTLAPDIINVHDYYYIIIVFVTTINGLSWQ